MPVASDSLRLVVTAAPGTGSTSLLAWSRGLPDAVDLLAEDLLHPDGRVRVDAKHATVTQLIDAGVWSPSGHAIVTSTRNPFDHWHAEWFRTRTRWSEDAADPASWVHRVPGMHDRIHRARQLPFDDWLVDALAGAADAGETHHLNPGHVTEADLVLRMEHLGEDLAHALPRLGVCSQAIPHHNRTTGRPPYAHDYTFRARALVEQVHAPDLDRFGYRF